MYMMRHWCSSGEFFTIRVQNVYNRICDGYRDEHVERYVTVLRMIVDIDMRNKT
jgi:hypothetical protein